MGDDLLEDQEEAAVLINEAGGSPYVLVCEHAGNRIPRALGRLGLAEADLTRHIAWDIGAEGVARLLSRLIDAPLVLQRYSRLVYDCNRPPESAGAMPEVSETTRIPGNENLRAEDKLARIAAIYRPFHAAVAAVLDARAAHGQAVNLVSIHSFTPVYKGKRRDFELGILHNRDTRLADRLAKGFAKTDVRRNEPYGPKDGVLHTLDLHAGVRGLKHAMIEVRNDLIGQERGQEEWGQRISVALRYAAQELE
ncbi:MAG: N-formylglutamate amidohydrolase [Hyphomicrobiales bacterium]